MPWSSKAKVFATGHSLFVAIALEIFPQVGVVADAGCSPTKVARAATAYNVICAVLGLQIQTSVRY